MRLEPAALRSRVKHSTTEPLRSQQAIQLIQFTHCYSNLVYVNNHWMLRQYKLCTCTMITYYPTCILLSQNKVLRQATHQSSMVPNCLQRLSADNESPLACKEINTNQLVDTTFWLKPWLKLISFGSNFFYLAMVLATTNSESG